MNLYFYDKCPRPENNDYGRSEYRGLVPFAQGTLSQCGLFECFGHKLADIFYGGQWHEKWFKELVPEHFEYLAGNESKHIFDLEGDANRPIPSWLQGCTLICMNAMPEQRTWPRIYVRLGLSFLLARIAHGENFINPQIEPRRGFSFMGQLFPLRWRMLNICKELQLPGIYGINPFWGSQLPDDHPKVHQFVSSMQGCSFALCPHGNGPGMSTRLYEACYFGRVPILIGDNALVGEFQGADLDFVVRLPSTVTDEELKATLIGCMDMPDSEVERRMNASAEYFEDWVEPQLQDPTGTFLKWYRADVLED